MNGDILRAELEKHFDLSELLKLSHDFLGFDPKDIGGTGALGSFAEALTNHCIQQDAVEALCDVLIASRRNVSPAVAELGVVGLRIDKDLPAGGTIDGYKVTRKLGEGRLGLDYLARKDGKDYRVKVIRKEATRDARGLHRFLTTTRLAARVSHSCLPTGLIAKQLEEHIAIIHDYVEGQTLAQRITRTGPLHFNEARPILLATLRALAALHKKHIAHGDVRRTNVFVRRAAKPEERVLLVDCGSDRLRARASVGNGRSELFSTTTAPETASPEQLKGLPASPKSDLYSFGALMFETLTGKPVFTGSNALELAFSHLQGQPPAPSTIAPKGWIFPALDEFILKMLAKDPNARPDSAEAVATALERLERPAAKKSPIPEKEIEKRLQAVLDDPLNEKAAIDLEQTATDSASAQRVAGAFYQAAESLLNTPPPPPGGEASSTADSEHPETPRGQVRRRGHRGVRSCTRRKARRPPTLAFDICC